MTIQTSQQSMSDSKSVSRKRTNLMALWEKQ